jgi:hypothetical protein
MRSLTKDYFVFEVLDLLDRLDRNQALPKRERQTNEDIWHDCITDCTNQTYPRQNLCNVRDRWANTPLDVRMQFKEDGHRLWSEFMRHSVAPGAALDNARKRKRKADRLLLAQMIMHDEDEMEAHDAKILVDETPRHGPPLAQRKAARMPPWRRQMIENGEVYSEESGWSGDEE